MMNLVTSTIGIYGYVSLLFSLMVLLVTLPYTIDTRKIIFFASVGISLVSLERILIFVEQKFLTRKLKSKSLEEK